MFQKKNYNELAEKIKDILKVGQARRAEIGGQMRLIVAQNHSVENLIGKIVNYLK